MYGSRWTAIAAAAVVLGLAIGALLGMRARAQHSIATTTTVAQNTAPAPAATPSHVLKAAVQQTQTPAVQATATPRPATPRPAPPPTTQPTPTLQPTQKAAPAPVAPAADVPARDVQIVETNTSVGTIVWTGTAVSNGGTLRIDVRKAQVGGQAVGPCERATHLRATVSVGAQNAPYEEVNCSGAASDGQMQIAWRSADGRAMRGSFWLGGAKLGDFSATSM